MSRRHEAQKREVLPDSKFHNVTLAMFINCLMKKGKKSIAERIVYDALEKVRLSTQADPIEAFIEAINNVRPKVEVRSRRVGGATYQVPVEVPGARSTALAIRWIINSSRKRSEKSMKDRVASEITDASSKVGLSVKKCEDTHKMAEANKAFAHYRW